jgi:hypothetical protein
MLRQRSAPSRHDEAGRRIGSLLDHERQRATPIRAADEKPAALRTARIANRFVVYRSRTADPIRSRSDVRLPATDTERRALVTRAWCVGWCPPPAAAAQLRCRRGRCGGQSSLAGAPSRGQRMRSRNPKARTASGRRRGRPRMPGPTPRSTARMEVSPHQADRSVACAVGRASLYWYPATRQRRIDGAMAASCPQRAHYNRQFISGKASQGTIRVPGRCGPARRGVAP